MNKKGLQKSSFYIICFFCQNFLNYSNSYDAFPNIHVLLEQICCLYHYFLIVLNFLNSHPACVLGILMQEHMRDSLHLDAIKMQRNLCTHLCILMQEHFKMQRTHAGCEFKKFSTIRK